jgi:hypothetical protein
MIGEETEDLECSPLTLPSFSQILEYNSIHIESANGILFHPMQPESGNWGLEGKILVWNEALLKS